MKKKRVLCVCLTAAMLTGLLGGCGSAASTSTASDAAASTDAGAAATSAAAAETPAAESTGDKETVNFWYLWGGDEAKYIEQIIAAYNESQDKYEVVGLSTPDQQKVLTGISGGNGPDITDDFGSDMANYANENIALALDDYIAKDGIDTSAFVTGTLDQQQYDGKTYAFPISANVFALYYNKDLLEEAGYKEPPKTLEEMEEMSFKMTKSENGQITQLGAPLVPTSYWYNSITFDYGTDYGQVGNLTPDNEGFRNALTYLHDYVAEFGSDAVNSYVTSGQSKVNSAQDPFLAGQAAFRIDGTWFYKMAEDAGLNFGLELLPAAESQNGQTYSYLDTSCFYIPSTAKNPDGAWDFLKYITMGDGAKMFITLKKDLPALNSLLDDPDVTSNGDSYSVYLKVLSESTLKTMPSMLNGSDYATALSNAVDSVMLGGSVDDAIATAVSASEGLK